MVYCLYSQAFSKPNGPWFALYVVEVWSETNLSPSERKTFTTTEIPSALCMLGGGGGGGCHTLCMLKTQLFVNSMYTM